MRVRQEIGTKGSLKWIQSLIEYHSATLTHALQCAGVMADATAVTWVSPREADEWAEYRDAHFLRQLELGQHVEALRNFWPANGPQWDALGRTTDGRVILVEAKAHVGELASTCGAVSDRSRERIKSALTVTQSALDVEPSKDWMSGYYQYANRLAHLHFLRSRGVDAHLVFVYFTNDADMPRPNDRDAFEKAIAKVHDALGFPAHHAIPFVANVFIDVSELVTPEPVGDDMPYVNSHVFDTESARDAYLEKRGWQ